MSVLNPYYPRANSNEHTLYQSLINESISVKGELFYYIPRKLVDPDPILTEDNLSKFKGSFEIAGYIDEIDHWGGQGQFMQKFGVFIEEQATISISKERWEALIGTHGETILPHRPCEGDLLWFPVTQSLFEIRYVQTQSPFYQLHHKFMYKLKVELFSYSSERFETGIEIVDNDALDRTFDLLQRNVETEEGDNIITEEGGEVHTESPAGNNSWGDTGKYKDESKDLIDFDEGNPFADYTR
jgi:hypothetical protein